MPILTKPSFGPRTAMIYVTVGALLDVWTIVWYFAYAQQQPELSSSTKFWLWGLFLTGITLMALGFALGSIGRSARKSELPPLEATAAEAHIQQTAAASPHPIATTPAGPAVISNGLNGPVVTMPAAPVAQPAMRR